MAIDLIRLPMLTLFRGATSIVTIDLSDWDMTAGTCLFTLKHKITGEIVKQEMFTTAEQHTITFRDDETIGLTVNIGMYYYDIMLLVGEERYPQCAPSPVTVKEVVGSYVADG